MRVRIVWPQCDFRHGKWDAPPLDAYWVEATREDAEALIFPHLDDPLRDKSLTYGLSRRQSADPLGATPLPFCFLVACDLSAIEPMDASYPFSSLWNDECPFVLIPEFSVRSLEELRDRAVPRGRSDGFSSSA